MPVTDKQNPNNLTIIPRDQHSISRRDISEAALDVLYTLNRAGFEAYLVGGGVRDLLLERKPKDFDVATNATPDQIRPLFRRARIIGKRFQIVHVPYGREVIEVTTFRAHHKKTETRHHVKRNQSGDAVKDHSGMLLRDNVFGSIEEDASRRDFTINALYYNIADFSVRDFCGGIDDLKNKTLRLIGEPSTRYQEDPVRILRAARFEAKLGFTLARDTAQPIPQFKHLLKQISSARLFDEVLKLLSSGFGEKCFERLQHHQLFEELFPATAEHIAKQPEATELLIQAVRNTDKRIAEGKSVTPAFIYAAMLWPVVNHAYQHNLTLNMPPMVAMHNASTTAITGQLPRTSIPKRFSFPMREIWEMQVRLTRRKGKQPLHLMTHPRFRAGYDFLLLRESSMEIPKDLGPWWTALQETNPPVVSADHPSKRRPPKKRPR